MYFCSYSSGAGGGLCSDASDCGGSPGVVSVSLSGALSELSVVSSSMEVLESELELEDVLGVMSGDDGALRVLLCEVEVLWSVSMGILCSIIHILSCFLNEFSVLLDLMSCGRAFH